VTGYGLDGRGWIPDMGKRFFSLLYSVQTGSEAHLVYPVGTDTALPLTFKKVIPALN
jgi:hypothetical protein